ncbi:hypothetical protein D3C80_1159090 [compost metagenome]
MPGPALIFNLRQAEFAGNLFQQWQFALIAAELVLLVAQRVGMAGGPGVFQVRAEGCIGQAGAAVELVILQLGQDPEALGVAFEIEKVGTLGVGHCIEPAAPGCLLEPVANGIFTGMAKGRVADVVSKAG